MLQRILVPLDGSKRAERALPVAYQLARHYQATILLVQVVNLHWPNPYSLTCELHATAQFNAEKYLRQIKETEMLQDLSVETLVPFGTEAGSILATAYYQKADCIVMCSHGYSGMTKWAMGSVAEQVSRHTQVPLLFLRDNGSLPIGPHPDPTRPLRVLIPLDGSLYSQAALEPAVTMICALARSGPAAVHLLRVIPQQCTASGGREETKIFQKAKQYLQSIVASLKDGSLVPLVAEYDIPVTWSIAVDHDVASSIIRVAENGEDAENAGVFGGCDVIAMSTHGLSGIPRLTMGSITERVRQKTTHPLIIVRPVALQQPFLYD